MNRSLDPTAVAPRRAGLSFVSLTIVLLLLGSISGAADRTAWMREAKWGVMHHYLADWKARETGEPMSVDRWNQLIDAFDVAKVAEQVASVGAGYYLISIGQNSGYYLSPNAAYDRFVGIDPSKCARRDLVADLHAALQPRGVRLMVYLPSGAPNGDRAARTALQWTNGPGPYPNIEFQLKWEQVIREWSDRWGTKVAGWWFDGCYWPNTMYRSETPPNFQSFAAAARSGNPGSALAFCPGVVYRTISITPHEDYIAGEVSQLDRWDPNRIADGNVDGAQLHVLTYLGTRWGMGTPRFAAEEITAFAGRVASLGGVLTCDVPVGLDGAMAPEFLDQLKAIDHAVRNPPPPPDRPQPRPSPNATP